jgi:predicted phage terminase large subunit-like protein
VSDTNRLDLSAYSDKWFADPLGREIGEPLNPAQFTKEQLEVRQRANARQWAALWQQSPRPMSGNLINPDWFQVYDINEVPHLQAGNTVRAWDFAYSEKQVAKTDPDWTVGVKVALWKHNGADHLVLLDLIRFRKKWHGVKNELMRTAGTDGRAVRIYIETGGPQKAAASDIETEKLLTNYRVRSMNLGSDKVARAQPWADIAEAGRFIVIKAPWNDELFREVRAFPHVAHDDQVDAISLAYWALEPKMRGRSVTIMSSEGLYQ